MMIELAGNFVAEIKAGPQWVYWWVNFMGVVIALSLPFALVRVEARWVLLVMTLNALMMLGLYAIFGYGRILGLPHVILWTPLVVYLWRRRAVWRVRDTLSGKWLMLLVSVMVVSLVMDYADVARFFLS